MNIIDSHGIVWTSDQLRFGHWALGTGLASEGRGFFCDTSPNTIICNVQSRLASNTRERHF